MKEENIVSIGFVSSNQLIEFTKWYIEFNSKEKVKTEALKGFNPNYDIVISQCEFNALKGLKTSNEILLTMAKQVEQLHKLQTGELFNSDANRKLTAKEMRIQEENESKARIQRMRNEANLRALRNL